MNSFIKSDYQSLTNISWFVGLYISLYLLRVGLPNWIRCVCRYLQFLRSFITCQTSILSNLFTALDSKGFISESGIAGIGISCHPPIGTDALRDRRSQGRIIQCTIIQGRRQSQVSLIGVATRRTEIAEIVEISSAHYNCDNQTRFVDATTTQLSSRYISLPITRSDSRMRIVLHFSIIIDGRNGLISALFSGWSDTINVLIKTVLLQ